MQRVTTVLDGVGYGHRRLQRRNKARPDQDRPPQLIYRLRMRNADDQGRNTWASFVKAARVGIGMSGAEFARQVGVGRETVWRWEAGRYRPEDPAVVKKVADVLNVDLDEALAAAGFRPDVEPPAGPTRPPDPEIDRIERSKLSAPAKRRLIARIKERRQREQEQRLADLEDLIRAQERLER